MKPINVFISGPSKQQFSKEYLEKLGILLAAHFTEVTGMELNGRRWFMFNTSKPVQSSQPNAFVLLGDIIGANSMGYSAEIAWQEEGGVPVTGGWSRLCVDELQKDYGERQPVALLVGVVPFEIDWVPFWESHLPEDFYTLVFFESNPTEAIVDRIRKFIANLKPDSESVKCEDTVLKVHIDFGSTAPVKEHIQSVIHFLKLLHDELSIQKIQIGSEG